MIPTPVMTGCSNPTVIQVKMLGQFSITIGERSICAVSRQAKKTWGILEYLIACRKRPVSSDELIDLIWSDEQRGKHSGSLKTLIFRSRKLLEPLGIPPQELLIPRAGSYGWNTEFPIQVDAEVFEQMCLEAEAETDSERQLALSLDAIRLYEGDFLPHSAWETWVIPISAYYHSLFLQTARRACDLLVLRDDWETVIRLTQKAISIEPFDDDFHYTLIYALHSSGRRQEALTQYTYTIDLFYQEFAVTPSERLKALYKIISQETHGINMDLSAIQESMNGRSIQRGAYLCEFTVFQDIYQLQRRAIQRTGDSVQLCLLTIGTEQGKLPTAPVMAQAMEALGSAIAVSLRRGDVYTRYSIAQYMLILPAVCYEDAHLVTQRIVQNFKKQYTKKDLMIHVSHQAILPI